MEFSNILIKWYLLNKRDLPWRNVKDPYTIWLSEIILQQTRVNQGLTYFLSFISRYPTIFDLAEASEEDILKLWQGLGYYSRARNLHKSAKTISIEMNGLFPENYKKLLNLHGIGEYTAAAIASFAYQEPIAVVDGNVFRVLSRIFNVENDITQGKSKKLFYDIAFKLMPKDNSAQFNQAIMEFGALQCVPKNPVCKICVFNEFCAAFKNNNVKFLPVKSKKNNIRNRFLNYLIFEDERNFTIVNKRTEKDIWQYLYEFPLIESDETANLKYILAKISSQNKIILVEKINEKEIIHKLTHQRLHIIFWRVNVTGTLSHGIDLKNLMKLPFPIVIYNFIEKKLH